MSLSRRGQARLGHPVARPDPRGPSARHLPPPPSDDGHPFRAFAAAAHAAWLILGMAVRPHLIGFTAWRKLVTRVVPRVLLSVVLSALMIPMMFVVRLLVRPSGNTKPTP